MKHLKLIIVIVVLSSLLVIRAGEEIKIEDCFKVYWESINYSKNVSVYNPEVSSNRQPNSSSENVQMSCKIEILDPNLIIGTCERAVITQITDSKGKVIETNPELPDTRSMNYSGLRYDTKTVWPEREPKWKEAIETVLMIREKEDSGPRWIMTLRPSTLRMELSNDILLKAGEEIGGIKGYFYVLVANSIKNIDVPFKAKDNWIRLTNYREIKINKVELVGDHLIYEIEERWLGQNRRNSLNVGDYLPEQIVTARRFLKDDGSLSNHFMGGFPNLPAHVGGGGSMGGGDVGKIRKIRFVIAQDPNHVKIPFEFKNIPIPKP